MPTMNFECKKCKKPYESIVPFDETGKYKTVKCPECESKTKTVLMTACNYAFAQPEGTDKWNSMSKGHDFRFKHNIPKVKQERQMAEALSHMGTNPYGTGPDDVALDTGIHDPETRGGLS